MKKILTVAALLAMSLVPATPSFAAMAPAAAAPMKPSGMCFFMPLLPDCMTEWKAMHPGMMKPMAKPAPKMAMMAPKMAAPAPKMAAPAPAAKMGMMMPTCTPAPAGSAFMFVCKM